MIKYVEGQEVYHTRFGRGIIKNISNDDPPVISVEFSDETKNMLYDQNLLLRMTIRGQKDSSPNIEESRNVHVASKASFFSSLVLPSDVEIKQFEGMDRFHFKYKGKGFMVIDLKNDNYQVRTKEEYLNAIGVKDYDYENGHPTNPAKIKNIPYSDTNILKRVIDYVTSLNNISNNNMENHTYLLTWNPNKWDFEGGYKTFLKSVNSGENPIIEWRATNESIEKGDALFLMRLGEEPRGIILKGIAMSSGHPSKHYEAERAEAGEMINCVDVKFISAGDYSKGEYIDWKVLKERFPEQNWIPQASGIKIKNEYCDELNELWNQIAKNNLTEKDIKHNLVIIKINKTYHKGMSARELYEYTRGFWKRRIESVSSARYALAVVDGVVIEVYKIDKWVHASQADNITREYVPERHSNRIAFYGEVATDDIRNYYIGRNVNSLYKWGEADPVKLMMAYYGADSDSDSINVPMRPKNKIIKVDGSVRYVCGRCSTAFSQSLRCPECGQLVKE